MFSYNPLWKMLIDKGLNKTTFAQNCGISKTTLAKMSKGQYIDMKSLDKICNYFNCNISDIVEHIEEN